MLELIDFARLHQLVATGAARRARLAASLSLLQVAAAVGTTHASISRWELGRRRPRSKQALCYLELIDGLLALQRQTRAREPHVGQRS
jgi:transcriptional regulator with XRE-family HTH domain